MNSKILLFIFFIMGVVLSQMISLFVLGDNSNNRVERADTEINSEEFYPNEITSSNNNGFSEQRIHQEIAQLNRSMNLRMDKIEKKLNEAQSDDSVDEYFETENEKTNFVKVVGGNSVDRQVNMSTMDNAIDYVDSQIESGRWTLESVEYMQSISKNLTKKQLIDIQLTLNEAINTNKISIEYDLTTIPLF